MKIALLGYGKMGRSIEKLALAAGHEVSLKIDLDNQAEMTADNLSRSDVAIEFSRPESAFDNIAACLRAGVPVVSGTTGWLDRFEEVQALCRKHNGAFLYASNFSIGVNLFFALNRYLARLMDQQEEYEVSLEETHHIHKLDAPSGTAITLAEDIIGNLKRLRRWAGEEKEGPDVLPIASHRIGEVPGTHQITYTSAIDTITIRHEAHSREGFARGALSAAEWIVGRTGCFEMKDMLGF